MAETSETPREFADRIGPKIAPCDLNSNMAKSHIATELAARDAAIRATELARAVKRLREWSATWRHRADQEWMLPEHGLHDEFAARALALTVAAQIIESDGVTDGRDDRNA